MLKWRGLNFETNVRISKWVLEPGFGFGIRYNYGIDVVQIPLIFSATLNDYVRFYAGPVITFVLTELAIIYSFPPCSLNSVVAALNSGRLSSAGASVGLPWGL